MTDVDVLKMVTDAVTEKDDVTLELIVRIIQMHESAKQLLRKKGYGWAGLDLYKTCELIPRYED